MSGGWIKLWRAIEDNDAIATDPAAYRLFCALLLRAQHAPREVFFLGGNFRVNEGQALISQRKLAAQIGLTYKTLRNALARLQRAGMVTLENAHSVRTTCAQSVFETGAGRGASATLVSVCNWGRFQGAEDNRGASMGAERGAGGAQEGRTEQEREELEKESISSPPASQAVDSETGKPDENLAKPKAEKRPTKEPDGFEEFWAAYPRRLAKGTARKAYAKAITKIEPTALLRAVKRQANAWTREGKEQQFIPHPATWLNGERWQDEAGKRRKPPDGDLRDVPLADWATDYA